MLPSLGVPSVDMRFSLQGCIARFIGCKTAAREPELRFGVALLRGIWVVVKIMVPFWVLIILQHLIFRVPKKGP